MRARVLILLCTAAIGTCLASPRASAASDDQVVAARDLDAFAAGLYGQLRQREGNLFFSPESIATALAMTMSGAHGDTATEMASVLRLTLPPERLHPALGGMLRGRNAHHNGYQLTEADALWGQQGYTFHNDFRSLVKTQYGAPLTPLDFKGGEAARQTINHWVARETQEKITDLIGPGVLTADTRLVLTNAIYFKSPWQMPFGERDTSSEDFHAATGRTVKMAAMHSNGAFNFLDGGSFQALELPYLNHELSMVVFLPKATDGLPGFEQLPLDQKLPLWLSQLEHYPEIVLSLPKFTVRAEFSLGAVLQTMGMKHAFDANGADFSGISDGKLYISAVIHQAFVAVDEQGTEAAAATAVVGLAGAAPAPPDPRPPIVFRANHPFLFLIRENQSGIILFMGRVADPTA